MNTLSPDTAKQLRAAGVECERGNKGCKKHLYCKGCNEPEYTLEGLLKEVESRGWDETHQFTRHKGDWVYSVWKDEPYSVKTGYRGPTKLEAVSLALLSIVGGGE